ncbi:hypothetical protein LQF12_11380 [Ruania suaedae]|uniref:hypothetical protein n=1 Tax=Ruania suaedae TaxID=2897774 RepID=UPI001E5CFB5C|nr:hypothetical protein [Ruania suaedae]UFU02111.1 hypothetical protein LQF12_11380 [Ruania suaedae]
MTTPYTARVTAAADETLAALLDGAAPAIAHREVMRRIRTAAACALAPGSRWSGREEPILAAQQWLQQLHGLQAPSGLFTSGDNVDSPPDSSFTLNDLVLVCELLDGRTSSTGWAPVRQGLGDIAARAMDAVVGGGVHTPNHRWEISSALVGLARVTGQQRGLERARQWLAEGVDVDRDGVYSERSANYAAHVSNPSLLTLASALGREDLRGIVHRALHTVIDLTDAGEVETVLSRRQDQREAFPTGPFATQFRVFAVAGCPRCAAAARAAETAPRFDPVEALLHVLIDPSLAGELPEGVIEPVDRRFELGLWRRQDAERMLTVYGGSDVPAAGRVASGLACNPTLLRMRHGAALLDSVRLSRDFFGLGPFRGRLAADPDGTAVLGEDLATGYYQPLAEQHRRPDGAYPVEFEGRFAAAMAFSQRDSDEVRLSTRVRVREEDDGVSLEVGFSGADVPFALELAFRPGGTLTGGRDLGGGAVELVEGEATYRVGDEEIVVGPGNGTGADRPPVYHPGEAYTFLGGTDAVTGPRVYVTGRTSDDLVLTIRGRTVPRADR